MRLRPVLASPVVLNILLNPGEPPPPLHRYVLLCYRLNAKLELSIRRYSGRQHPYWGMFKSSPVAFVHPLMIVYRALVACPARARSMPALLVV